MEALEIVLMVVLLYAIYASYSYYKHYKKAEKSKQIINAARAIEELKDKFNQGREYKSGKNSKWIFKSFR